MNPLNPDHANNSDARTSPEHHPATAANQSQPSARRGGQLIHFPTRPPVPADTRRVAAPGVSLTGLSTRAVTLVHGMFTGPRTVQVKATAIYRLRQAPRDVTRLCWFVLRGHGRWIAKAWTWVSHADLRADVRAARLAGDAEARRTAQELIRADGRSRWTKLAIAARHSLTGALVIAFLAGVLALVDANVPRAQMWPWLAGVYTALGVLAVLGVWTLKLVPLGWLVAAVYEGRDRTPGAGWLVPPAAMMPIRGWTSG